MSTDPIPDDQKVKLGNMQDKSNFNINAEVNPKNQNIKKDQELHGQAKEFQGFKQNLIGQVENQTNQNNPNIDIIPKESSQKEEESKESSKGQERKTSQELQQVPGSQSHDSESKLPSYVNRDYPDFIRKENVNLIGKEQQAGFIEDLNKPLEQRHLSNMDYYKDINKDVDKSEGNPNLREPLLSQKERDNEGKEEMPSLKKREDNITESDIPKDIKGSEGVKEGNLYNPSSKPMHHKYDLDKPEVKEMLGSANKQKEEEQAGGELDPKAYGKSHAKNIGEPLNKDEVKKEIL